MSFSKFIRFPQPSQPISILPTIYEGHEFQLGVFLVCNNCLTSTKVANSSKHQIIPVSDCKSCFGYRAQVSVFSAESHLDMSQKAAAINKWLFHGKHHGESVLGHYINIPSGVDAYVSLIEDILLLAHHMLLGRNTFDRYLAVTSFCKKRGSRFSFTSSTFLPSGVAFI